LYQKHLKVSKRYDLDFRKSEILIFDELAYEKEQELGVLNIKTMEKRSIGVVQSTAYQNSKRLKTFLLKYENIETENEELSEADLYRLRISKLRLKQQRAGLKLL